MTVNNFKKIILKNVLNEMGYSVRGSVLLHISSALRLYNFFSQQVCDYLEGCIDQIFAYRPCLA